MSNLIEVDLNVHEYLGSRLVINETDIGTHGVLKKCESEISRPMNPIFDF